MRRPARHALLAACAAALLITTAAGSAAAQKKVYLNPSNQTSNPVSGGGNEAQYALIDAKLTKPILTAAGFSVTIDQDFTNAPKNANSWGADVFVSIHTNAGGGHGTETLYKTSGGKTLADKVQKGLLAALPYANRGLKLRTDLHVLNSTNMYACLLEAVFHDCSKTSGYSGHPPSEASFLKSTAGQQKIASGIASGVCSYFGKSCSGSTTTDDKGTLRGVVYRGSDMTDRIAGAKVKLDTGASSTASSTGQWSFSLKAGSYTITASAPGYVTASRTAKAVAGQEVWASIGLQPDATQPVADAGAPDLQLVDAGAGDDGGLELVDMRFLEQEAGEPLDGQRGDDGCSLGGGGGAGAAGWPGGAAVLLMLLWQGSRRRRRRR